MLKGIPFCLKQMQMNSVNSTKDAFYKLLIVKLKCIFETYKDSALLENLNQVQ